MKNVKIGDVCKLKDNYFLCVFKHYHRAKMYDIIEKKFWYILVDNDKVSWSDWEAFEKGWTTKIYFCNLDEFRIL